MKNKSLDFKFNSKSYHVNLVGCSIYPQAYPAIIERIGEFNGTNVIADIGSGTINILYIQNKKPLENKSWTEKLGVNQCVIAIRNAFMDKFGIKLDDGIIDTFLKYGTVDISKEYLACMKSVATKYAASVFDTLYSYEYNPKLMRLWIIGGGGSLIKHFGVYDKDRVNIVEDICANAKGCEYLAQAWFRRGADI